MRVTFLLILALCVYLSEAGRKDSDEDSGESKKYKKDKYNKYDKNNKNDKYNKQDKYNKYEKYDKYNKYEKSDKYNKYEKPNDKYNKYEKYDNRPQKYDRDDSDESQESHEAGDYNDFPLRNDDRREWRQPEALQYQDNGRSAERYPGGDGNFKEHGPNTKYNWKQDREDFQRMRPLTISPAEKRDFVPTADMPDPPAPSEAVKMARYIVHNADWTTVATISTLPHIRHYPFVNTLSVSDGPVENGSGIPYLYMTELDMTPHDLAVNRKCSLSMSLAETDYCKQQSLDPEDPRCAHVTITGEMWKLQNGTQSAKLAEEALFSRHPVMKTWPKDHNFFFATLKIEQIILLDYFGGPKYVDVKEYLRATLSA